MRHIPPTSVGYQSLTDVHGGSAGASRESEQPNCGVEYSATEDKVPLKVVYWNVAGINVGEIDTFLGQLDGELQWGVLILLEFPLRVASCIYPEFVKRDTLLLPSHLNMVGGGRPRLSPTSADTRDHAR